MSKVFFIQLLFFATSIWAVVPVCRQCGADYEQKHDPETGNYRYVHANNQCIRAPGFKGSTHDGFSYSPFHFRRRSAGDSRSPDLNQCETHNIKFPDNCPMCEPFAYGAYVSADSAGSSGFESNLLITPAVTTPSQPSGNYQSQALALGSFFLGQSLNNFIFAPWSQIDALHLLWTAASGATRELLHNFASSPNIQQAGATAYRQFGYLFFSNRFTLNPQWRETLPANTNAEVEALDFYCPATRSRAAQSANSRIAELTDGDMTEAINPGRWPLNTVLALYNICYFNAGWQRRLRSDTGYFYPVGGERMEVNTMAGEELTLGYYQSGDGWTAASLPYEGREFEMVFILPPEGILPSGATVELLGQILSSLEPREDAQFSAPFVILDSHFDLRESLQQIDLQNIACEELDLSNLLTSGPNTGAIMLTSIEQQCFLRMDNLGTVAGAVTKIVCSDGPCRTLFRVNRPYIVVLRSVKDQAILFLGAVYNPRDCSSKKGTTHKPE